MPDFQVGDIITLISDDMGEGVILALFPADFEARVGFPAAGPVEAVHWVPIDRLRFERRPEPDDVAPGGAS